MSQYPHLFEPFLLSSVRLNNRITMAPLFTMYAAEDGAVSRLTLEHYQELARGGAGMIVVANAAVEPDGSLSRRSLRADDDRFLEGLSQLSETIRQAGAAAVLQINHGGRFSRGKVLSAPSVVAFSDISIGGLYRTALKSMDMQQQLSFLSEVIQHRSQRLKRMTKADIQRVITAYADAALRAQKAGFDMVEIHGGTGYLPVQFLSRRTNKRRDRYGGALENRMRFALELVDAVKQAVGATYPVGYRFQADEWLPDGFSLDEARIFARRLSAGGIAYLSVTGGSYGSFANKEIVEKMHQPCYMVHLAEAIKAVSDVPVIASGLIVTPTLAENVLAQKKADLIGLARPLLADPQWPQKALAAEAETITCCDDCRTCLKRIFTGQPVLCSKWDSVKLLQRKFALKEMQKPNKKILIAMDGSENAVMGAAYAGEMLTSRTDVSVTLIHIQTGESKQYEKEIKEIMESAKNILIKAGISEKAITIVLRKKKTGIARDLLEEIAANNYGTVIVGRRGLSRTQQFLFGSVSNKIVQNAKGCTVWVVD